MSIDLSGLERFKNRLAKYANINRKFVNEVLKTVLLRAEQIAREEYAGFQGIEISYEILATGVGRIYAKGDEVAYIEFGTGLIGEQSNYPQDKLPQQPIEFESPQGTPQQTDGWEYYYDNPQTKVLGGWFYGNTFTQGQPAGMQMYKTSQRIKNEMSQIVKNKIEGGSLNV